MSSLSVCWDLLPQVSRSFAVCIRLLPRPLDEQMMLAYLTYRVLDTIEDSRAPVASKKRLFSQFLSLLSRKPSSAQVSACSAALLTELNYTYEKNLLERLDALVDAIYDQPRPVRGLIRKWGRCMAGGMYKFQAKPIKTWADQNRYAHFVAGVIGYLYNDLLCYHGIITASHKRAVRKQARDFGLALQKVNILRDVAEDLVDHRFYWPEQVIRSHGLGGYLDLLKPEKRQAALGVLDAYVADARKYLDSAMDYITGLPVQASGARQFCILPLFMAVEAYALCANNPRVFDPQDSVKVSREKVGEIMLLAQTQSGNNEGLRSWYEAALKRSQALSAPDARK